MSAAPEHITVVSRAARLVGVIPLKLCFPFARSRRNHPESGSTAAAARSRHELAARHREIDVGERARPICGLTRQERSRTSMLDGAMPFARSNTQSRQEMLHRPRT